MLIKVSEEFTMAPGGRHISDGDYSGEEFRERILKLKFQEAIKKGEKLTVDLDGGFGYGSSFLDEAFGGLARITKDRRMLDIEIISNEEPILIDRIRSYILDGLKG